MVWQHLPAERTEFWQRTRCTCPCLTCSNRCLVAKPSKPSRGCCYALFSRAVVCFHGGWTQTAKAVKTAKTVKRGPKNKKQPPKVYRKPHPFFWSLHGAVERRKPQKKPKTLRFKRTDRKGGNEDGYVATPWEAKTGTHGSPSSLRASRVATFKVLACS